MITIIHKHQSDTF